MIAVPARPEPANNAPPGAHGSWRRPCAPRRGHQQHRSASIARDHLRTSTPFNQRLTAPRSTARTTGLEMSGVGGIRPRDQPAGSLQGRYVATVEPKSASLSDCAPPAVSTAAIEGEL